METEAKVAGESKRDDDLSEPIMTTQEPHMVIDNNETGLNGMPPRRKSSVFGGLALPTKPRRASAAQEIAQEIPKAAAGPASEGEGEQVPLHRQSIQSVTVRRDSSTVLPPQIPDGEEEGDFARQLRLRTVERKSKLKPLVTPPAMDIISATEIETIKTPLKQGTAEEISRRSSISPKADSERRPSMSPKFDPTLRRGSDTMSTLELQPNEVGIRRSSVPPVDSVAEPLRRTSGTTVPPRRLSSSSSTSAADAPMPIPVQSPDNPNDTAVSTRLSIVDGFAVRRKSTTPTTTMATVNSPTALDQEQGVKQEQPQTADPVAVQKPQESPTVPPPPQEQPVVRPATSGQRPLRRGSMTKVKGFSAISEESFQARKNGVIVASATASGTLATPPPRRTVAEDVQTKPVLEDLNAPRRAAVQGEVEMPRKIQSEDPPAGLPPRRSSVPPSSGAPSSRPSVITTSPAVANERRSSQVGGSPTTHVSIADHATTVEGTPVVISSPASSRRSSLASDVAILSSPSAGPLELPVGPPSSRRPSALSLEGASPTPSRRGSFEAQPALTASNAVRPTVLGVARRRDSNPPSDNMNQQEEKTTMITGLGHRRKSSTSSLEEKIDAARAASSGENKSSSEAEQLQSSRLSALAGQREDEQKRSGMRDDSLEEEKRSSTEPSREDDEERTTDDQLMQQRRPHLQSSFSLFSASAGSRRMSTASSTTAGGGDETDAPPARRRPSMSLLGSLVRGPKRAAGEEEEEEESYSGPRRQSLAHAGEDAAETGEKDQERSSSSTAAMMDEAFLGRKDDSVDSSSSSPTKKRLSILGGFRRNSRSSGGESPLAMSATPTEETAFPSMQLASPVEDFVMEITEEERRAFEASQARKDSQALLKQMQAMSAKTTELAGLESELNRIQQEKSVARQATKQALDDNLLEQEDIERQIQALRQKKKALQLEAADLDGVLAEQELVEKKAAEERELARMALEQAQKEKQEVLHKYQDLQLKFPDKIRPISTKDMELLDGGMMMDQDEALLPPRSRRLTFPLPVHSPSPAPPLVLRGLFQLKKDPAIDKIAGASRVSNATRQVLFAAPGSISSTTKKAQGEPGKLSRPAAVIRRGGAEDSFAQVAVAGHNTQPPSLPKPPPRRPSLLNALQTGVSLKKVENPDEKRKSLSRGGAGADAGGGMMAMSRLVKTMSVRREVIEDPDLHEAVTEEEWA